jgi:DUF2911 family protein
MTIKSKYTITSKHALLLCLLCTGLSSSFAQHKNNSADNGLVVYTLGADTTIVQYFEYDNRNFKTTILDLNGQVQKYEGVGVLDETGDVKEIKSKLYHLNSTGDWFLVREAVNIFNGDSTIFTASGGNGKLISRRAFPGKGIVVNTDACGFYTFPYMAFFAPKNRNDSLLHCHFVFGECRTYHVTRTNKNELNVGSAVMGNIKLYLDNEGRLTSADAVGSALNFIGKVERDNKDYGQYIDQLAKTKSAGNSFSKSMTRDTAVLVVDNKKIEVDYWQPRTRGRVIFGNVVPWNRVWRTGANNATQLRTELELHINESKLPAGKYSVWTYPTETGWYLYINKKADVWGTEYDANENILKLKLNVERTTEKVETLKIDMLQINAATIRLQISWENYKAWADFNIH